MVEARVDRDLLNGRLENRRAVTLDEDAARAAQRDRVPVAEASATRDAIDVDVGAVAAAHVLQPIRAVDEGDERVLLAHHPIEDLDMLIGVTPERIDGAEVRLLLRALRADYDQLRHFPIHL